jgi:hypothetical protein
MILTAEVGPAINDTNNAQQHIQIHYTLIDNQRISDLLIHIVKAINKFIDTLYSNTFSSTVSYLWTDYNNVKSIVTFTSFLLPQFNTVIIYDRDFVKLFNIR